MIEALNDRIIARRASEKATAGGILLPNARGTDRAEVVGVGQGYLKRDKSGWIPVGVSVGDTVVFEEGSEMDIKVDGEDLVVIREANVLGVEG